MQPTVIAWEEAISKADHSDIEVVLPLVLYLSTARLWKDGNKKATKRGVFLSLIHISEPTRLGMISYAVFCLKKKKKKKKNKR